MPTTKVQQAFSRPSRLAEQHEARFQHARVLQVFHTMESCSRTAISGSITHAILLSSLLALFIIGCGGEQFSPSALAARKALQLERPQEALDKLTAEPVDDSAAGHYLKAIALERLDRADAAKAEAQIAIERAAREPKYQALLLRLKLFDSDESAIEPLLQLHEQNPSSAAVSLFAIFAYQAKHVRLRTEGKLRAARVQLEKAEVALKTAVSLAAQIPECQRELIGMALWFEEPAEALKLLDELLKMEPDNPDLLRDKTKVLVMSNRSADAISTGAQLYRRLERTEAAATEFANTLNRLPPSPAVLEQYGNLRDNFPTNSAILIRYCWSLGKAGRVTDACANLASAFDQQTDKSRRQLLAQSAISIPLEAGDTKTAEAQLKKYRDTIRSEQMLAYLEGRLAFQKKNYASAFERMQMVVEIYRTDAGASESMAREALTWVKRLSTEQSLTDQIRKAAELTLRRAGIKRSDEQELKEDARSLLQILEDEDQNTSAVAPDKHPENAEPTEKDSAGDKQK